MCLCVELCEVTYTRVSLNRHYTVGFQKIILLKKSLKKPKNIYIYISFKYLTLFHGVVILSIEGQ